MRKLRIVVVALLVSAVIASPAVASGNVNFFLGGKSLEKDDWDETAPLDIQSQQMSVNFQKHEIVFQGGVKVTQADFSLTAREVRAVFGEKAEDIRKIVAQGEVIIRKADKVARGQEAVYNRAEAVIVLRGDPYLEQGSNHIQGEEIRVFLNDNRMDIQGGVSAEFRVKELPDEARPGAEVAP